jgi:glycosyltransferase involved in cell wall biosynthesis
VSTIKAVITTLDNLPTLREQLDVLRADPIIDEIIVVSNGSQDGTNEFLSKQKDLVAVIRENKGAGPGRNVGIDAAGQCDYFLFLDGGIRPLRSGTERMFDYLQCTPKADVIGVEIADFETDYSKAWRRWSLPIEYTYRNTRLSHTAYCLSRYRAFDGLRFCEEGPFGQPGWGADDDEMAYRWNDAGIVVHVVSCQCNHRKKCTGVHPYRRASGSFRRLFKETGIWPNQYGSVYEQRVVWMQHRWPQYKPGVQWGEPEITAIIECDGFESTIKRIKASHDILRTRLYDEVKWKHIFHPYSIIVSNPDNEFTDWAQWRQLRHHHGDKTIIDGQIVRRDKENDELWTGDFIMSDDWEGNTRKACKTFVLIEKDNDLEQLRGFANG